MARGRGTGTGRGRGRPRKDVVVEMRGRGRRRAADAPPTENTPPAVGHNSEVRARIIRETAAKILALKAQLKRVAQPIRDEIKEIRHKVVKGDLGMLFDAWNVIEKEAAKRSADQDQESEGDSAAIFRNSIREGFLALSVGEQGSFAEALDAPEPPPRRSRQAAAAPIVTDREALERARHHLEGEDGEGDPEGDAGDDGYLPDGEDDDAFSSSEVHGHA